MAKKLIMQLLPRLWGTGRFSSVDDLSLEYFRSLGMDFIWYTGIPRHAYGDSFVKGNAGSPYAISDYYDTNEYLADNKKERMSELKQLIARTHTHSMKVVIDFVPNHVAPCYADSHGGIRTFDHCDYDWTDTRKIDYGPSGSGTWLRLRDILLFWAGLGVDGFRCDMVEMVPPEFFAWVIREVKERYPETLFIAEVYTLGSYRKYCDEVGFDLLYDKSGLYDSLRSVICGEGSAEAITFNWQRLGSLQSRMLNFLENHDEQRLASRHFAGSASKGYAALAVSALFNDASFLLYSGQEVGESAEGTPSGRTSIFDFVKVPGIEALYGYIHGENSLSGEQISVLSSYRKILEAASSPLFREGKVFDLCYAQPEGSGFDRRKHFAFMRSLEGRAVLVAVNFSDEKSLIDVKVPEEAFTYLGIPEPSSDNIFRITVSANDAEFIYLQE